MRIFRGNVKRNLSQIVGECCPLSILFVPQVQFGHAGASAHGENETAVAKNNVSFFFLMNSQTKRKILQESSYEMLFNLTKSTGTW